MISSPWIMPWRRAISGMHTQLWPRSRIRPRTVKGHQACLEALKISTLDQFPMDYADTKQSWDCIPNSGRGRGQGRELQEGHPGLSASLKVSTLDQFPMDYAMTQSNLGNAYRTLAEVEDKAENCQKAIKACEEALKVSTLDSSPWIML